MDWEPNFGITGSFIPLSVIEYYTNWGDSLNNATDFFFFLNIGSVPLLNKWIKMKIESMILKTSFEVFLFFLIPRDWLKGLLI